MISEIDTSSVVDETESAACNQWQQPAMGCSVTVAAPGNTRLIYGKFNRFL